MSEEADAVAIAAQLRLAMRRLPGPVALITTCEADGREPAGMVASAVIPLSMEPPSMVVAINRNTTTHAVVSRSGRFAINLLHTSQTAFVGLFSNHRMREQRFASSEWLYDGGLPYLAGASSSLLCRVGPTLPFGTHELFVGAVERVHGEALTGADPLGWIEGDFARLGRLA